MGFACVELSKALDHVLDIAMPVPEMNWKELRSGRAIEKFITKKEVEEGVLRKKKINP